MSTERILTPAAGNLPRLICRAALLMAVGGLASGCAVAQLGSMFGSSKNETTSSINTPVAPQERSLSMAAADMAPAARGDAGTDCPRISVWRDEGQLTIYEIGRVGDNLAIRHRGEITNTARECEIAPGQVTVKFGVAGRVLLGPLGHSGVIKMPILVHVTDKSREKVKTEKLEVSVTLDASKPYGNFSSVQRLSFPIPQGALPGDYNLFVTFDRNAPGAG